MKLRWITSLIVVVFSVGVAAAKPELKPEAKSGDAVKTDKVVCKKVKVTGSHFSKRICQKQSAWKRMEREAQRVMKRLEAGTSN